MIPVGILDVLADTEEWLNWTRHFGPISGHDSKLANPAERYLVTTFCYGFDFGPTQTSRSIRGLDRRQVAFVNQRHVTEDKLNEAITTVINGYNQSTFSRSVGAPLQQCEESPKAHARGYSGKLDRSLSHLR